MKKTLSVLMASILIISLFAAVAVPAAAAYTIPDNAAIERVIRSMGFMNGDANGNMNLTNSITRAELATLLVMVSTYRDSVSSGPGVSLFTDVKSAHWASNYIKTAVDAGWVSGYLDGSYRPDNPVLLEDAAVAFLKLLGYGPSDYVGSFPGAQISKFNSLRLNTGLSATQGSTLTRGDCMIIIYNLLSAAQKDGMVYGAVLGYPVDSEGYFDYDAYVDSKIEGPFVLASGRLASVLPFSAESAQIYRNGRAAAALSASLYDVYYYNELTGEVWIFSDRVVGLLTAIGPHRVSPENVTVGGNIYSLGTADAKRKVSSLGSYIVGDTIALLLGMNGEVVDIVEARAVDATYYGMVTSVELLTYNIGTGQSSAEFLASVACTDGIIRQCVIPGDYYSSGALVSVSYTDGIPEVNRLLTSRALSGTVNPSATGLGDYAFAEDIEIMEVSGTGEWTILYPSRLSRANLTGSAVRFYLLNNMNEIAVLILEDVTGDMYAYGIITSVSETYVESQSGGFPTINGLYSYIINGVPGVHNTTNRLYGISTGAGRFITGNNGISMIRNLSNIPLTELSAASMAAVGSDNKRYNVSDSVQVYIYSNSNYFLTELSAVTDTAAYSLVGYYENEFPAGGQLRIIVATRRPVS